MGIPIFAGPGFIVEDLGLATHGLVTPTTVYEVGDAVSPAAAGQDTLGLFHGVDLFYNGDLQVLASGDLRRTTGIEGFKAAFVRSMGVSPGALFWRPNYGLGIAQDFLNRPQTADVIWEIKNRIRHFLGSHPAVEAVSRLEVVTDDGPIGLIEIYVELTIAGQLSPLELSIRRN